MKQFLFFLVFVCSFSANSQETGNRKQKGRPPVIADTTVARKVIESRDSILESIQQKDSVTKTDFDSNIDALYNIQQENRERQKKAALVRIAIGVGFLALLIFGFWRRRKKK